MDLQDFLNNSAVSSPNTAAFIDQWCLKIAENILQQNYDVRFPASVLDRCSYLLREIPKEDVSNHLRRSIFRLFRTCCAYNQQYQKEVLEDGFILTESVAFLNVAIKLNARNEEILPSVRICLQFLGNFLVENSEGVQKLYKEYQQILFKFLTWEDEKILNYSLMNLKTILQLRPEALEDWSESNLEDILKLIDYEFGLLCFEQVSLISSFYQQKFISLSRKVRKECMRLLAEHTSLHRKLPQECQTAAAACLISNTDVILKSNLEFLKDEEFGGETAASLHLLTCLSALEESNAHLKADVSLITNCIFTLQVVHKAGLQQSDDAFRPIEKLNQLNRSASQESSNPEDAAFNSPTFSFKANLVRLIGNLVHGHEHNQNLVRELEGLSVILDCSKIDARNPFIMQCCVFTIHNLCEGNLLNQAFIASLTKKGVIENCWLEQFGFILKQSSTGQMYVERKEK